ncbi:MAG TPA: 2-dehydropantoate 2-reductase N-terminal domain-containing protein, partial [Patescibacteria group bacterium]|nr:2-dehydropantoate 2-reductase N-terminal domain-containing protein [Patescibacteria group bacterium]
MPRAPRRLQDSHPPLPGRQHPEGVHREDPAHADAEPAARRSVKIVIVGAGATGAFLGARMARVGVDVTLVARGAHLAAMRER